MRFLHTDFEPISAYLRAGPIHIERVEWRYPALRDLLTRGSLKSKLRVEPPRPASIEEIEAAFHRGSTPEFAGTTPMEYFSVNAAQSDRALSMAAAIEHIEAQDQAGAFLLVGYADGGLISISRGVLPFQRALTEATWWAP